MRRTDLSGYSATKRRLAAGWAVFIMGFGAMQALAQQPPASGSG